MAKTAVAVELAVVDVVAAEAKAQTFSSISYFTAPLVLCLSLQLLEYLL